MAVLTPNSDVALTIPEPVAAPGRTGIEVLAGVGVGFDVGHRLAPRSETGKADSQGGIHLQQVHTANHRPITRRQIGQSKGELSTPSLC